VIELFDASRLVAKRDHSLPPAALVLALATGGLSVYANTLQGRLRQAEAEKQQLATTLREKLARPAPSPTLLADLERQLQGISAELAATAGPNAQGAQAVPASAWLNRLETLTNAEISLTRIDIERSGSAKLEGLAASAQAVSGFVQAFSAKERQDGSADVRARAVEVRHDKTTAPYLRFMLRATAPQQASATPNANTEVSAMTAAATAAEPMPAAPLVAQNAKKGATP
jgi:hypothetical protein